jgi:Xaa-Pro aminopeptidase
MSDSTPVPEPDVSAEHPISENWVWVGPHRPAVPRVLVEQMTRGWRDEPLRDAVHPSADVARARREWLGARFAGRTLVVPTGMLKVRANDTDYRFRPGSDFF